MKKRFSKNVVAAKLTCLLVIVLAAVLGAGTSEAATVAVDCDAGAKLQDAINSLDPVGPHTINVTGTCRENVFLDQRARLTIQGPAGGTATIVSPLASRHVVEIWRSHAITLRRLVITGGNRGVFIIRGSEVQILSSRVENNTTGFFVTQGSTVTLQGTSTEPMLITNNNGSGIVALDSVVWLAGFTRIENNGRFGVQLNLGNSCQIFGQGNAIRGNGFVEPGQGAGIRVRKSDLNISNTDISGNSGHGVLADVNGTVGLANVTLMHNTGDGVRVLRGATALLGEVGGATAGNNTITGNGGADLACDTTGLVVLISDQTIPKINCMRIERELGPPRPGEIDPD